MPNTKKCKHEKFNGMVDVGRIVNKDPIEFVVDLRIFCDECGLEFLFDEDHFVVNAEQTQLRYKLKPGNQYLERAA